MTPDTHHPHDHPHDPRPDPARLPGDHALARRRLRAAAEGLLRFDDLHLRRPYILDPATGDPVAPIPAAVLAADEVALFIPDESADALQLLVQPIEIDPSREAAADRWRIYHGTTKEPRWARLEIQSARAGRDVFDGPELRGPAPFAADEPAALARLNADPARLAVLCRRAVGIAPADPRAVGLDPDGLDIRARFGIIRIPFDPPAPTIADARAALDRLAGDSR